MSKPILKPGLLLLELLYIWSYCFQKNYIETWTWRVPRVSPASFRLVNKLMSAAGRSDAADPVLPRLPQNPEPAHVSISGRSLGAHQPAPPHGRGQEAQAQLLTKSTEPRSVYGRGTVDSRRSPLSPSNKHATNIYSVFPHTFWNCVYHWKTGK